MIDPRDRPPESEQFRPVADQNVTYWEPSGVVTTMWVALSIVLGALGMFLLGLIYAVIGSQPADGELAFDWIIIVPLAAGVLVVHQLIHAAIARLFGGSPKFDFDVIQYFLPVIYCRVTRQMFTRPQFLAYALAPLLILTSLGIALMPVDERAFWLIIPLALNASLSIRDVWMAWVVWSLPRESLIEAERDGLRLIRPQ